MVDNSQNLVIMLGEGNFSKILKISELQASKHFNLNITNNYLSAGDKEKLENELILAKDFKGKEHPNIVTVYEAEKIKDTICWKIELCDTNLKILLRDLDNPKQALNEFIAKKRIVNLKERITIVSDLIEGWKFLYDNKITHRNIKPENILINFKNGEIRAKISDWGVLEVLDQKFLTPKILKKYLFIAPEYENLTQFDDRFDVWAMGIIIFLIIYGKYPFIRILNEDALKSKDKWLKLIKKAE